MKKIIYSLVAAALLMSCSAKKEGADASAVDTVAAEQPETEEAELASRAAEEEEVFNSLNVYDGSYQLYTESEGAEGKLTLKYLGDRSFTFSLSLMVADVCEGIIEDTAFVDRTQHAFYRTEGCILHFELLGQNIEINAEEACDKMKGDCSFNGVYQSLAEAP